jgi:hypothetical protein
VGSGLNLGALANLIGSLRRRVERMPTAFSLEAQGCETASNPGNIGRSPQPQRVLRLRRMGGPNLFRVVMNPQAAAEFFLFSTLSKTSRMSGC